MTARDLPEAFVSRMKTMLGDEYPAFEESYDRPRRGGLRINALKKGLQEPEKVLLSGTGAEQAPMFGAEQIPWAPGGFYYDPQTRPGKHPFHEAGVYYMQEPSAMAVAALSGVKPGMRVLDLCAAPGGKSTQLASMLGGKGVLYANEIHPARARILSQNIERMGIANAIVTNETPQKMEARFPMYFDTVVVDAPCSGEGMFVKEAEAVPNWSEENVELCARRQREILDCAAQMTASGGTLLYSTCTFAPQEDEQNVLHFLRTHPDFVLTDLPALLGREYMDRTGLASGEPSFGGSAMGAGEDEEASAEMLGRCIRLWPHRLEGEGHFMAVFHKEGTPFERRSPAALPLKDREALKLLRQFADQSLTKEGAAELGLSLRDPGMGLILFGNELYRLPEGADLSGLKVLRPGLHLGTVKKNRFEPSHALALHLGPGDVKCRAEICAERKEDPGDSDAASAFLRGESLLAQDCREIRSDQGWCLVTDCGFSMGWGKLSGGRIRNHYPKGLRRPY